MDVSDLKSFCQSMAARPEVGRRRAAMRRRVPRCEALEARSLLSALSPSPRQGSGWMRSIAADVDPATIAKLDADKGALLADAREGKDIGPSVRPELRSLTREFASLVKLAIRTSPTVPGTGEKTARYLAELAKANLTGAGVSEQAWIEGRAVPGLEGLAAGLRKLPLPPARVDRFLNDFAALRDRVSRTVSALASQTKHDVVTLYADVDQAGLALPDNPVADHFLSLTRNVP